MQVDPYSAISLMDDHANVINQVYCGECCMNRHVSKSKKTAAKNRGKPEPFKVCVVADCKKPVTSKTALFQIYL
jgi:hypothetical protein